MRSSRSFPAVSRAFDVLDRLEIYEPVGRRPAHVYVDKGMNVTEAADAAHRLSDVVYRRAKAKPGDQLQECSAGLLLVTSEGACRPVRLSEPQALDADTAFRHAQIAAEADRAAAERLLAVGKLAEAEKARRPTQMPPQPNGGAAFPEDAPLVVESKASASASP